MYELKFTGTLYVTHETRLGHIFAHIENGNNLLNEHFGKFGKLQDFLPRAYGSIITLLENSRQNTLWAWASSSTSQQWKIENVSREWEYTTYPFEDQLCGHFPVMECHGIFDNRKAAIENDIDKQLHYWKCDFDLLLQDAAVTYAYLARDSDNPMFAKLYSGLTVDLFRLSAQLRKDSMVDSVREYEREKTAKLNERIRKLELVIDRKNEWIEKNG